MTQKKQQAERLGEDDITSLLVNFSLPATLAMAVNASYNIVDTIFVGRLGADAIAALSVSFPIQMLLGAIGIGTGVGAGSLIARSLGAQKHEDASTTVGQVLLLALFFGLVIYLTATYYLRPLLIFFGATPEILELCVDYLAVIANGAVMLFLIMMMNNTVRSEGNAFFSMIVMIASAGTNIILDPIFIFGFKMGIRGAAVATILAKVVGVCMLLWYYFSGRSLLTIRLTRLRPNLKTISEIYKVGLPSLMVQISINIALIIANRILGGFGYIPIAVMGLICRFQMFAFLPIVGISQGLLPIIGFNYGAKKYPRIREALLKGVGAGTIFSTLAGLVFFLFPVFFLRVFTSEPEVLAVGANAVRIMVVMYPLLGGQTVSITFFQAIGKGIPSMLLSVLRELLLYIPLILVLSNLFDLTGVWISRPIADLLAFGVTLLVVAREFKILKIPLYTSSPAHRS